MELPPQIGALKKLKFFDLEGTELMYLPKEIGKLETLECLRVSLSTYADDQKDRSGIEHILPRKTISKLTKLKELSISVNADAEWWEVELLEGVMGDLIYLPDLKTVKLYLPTAKALQEFLSLERYQVPIYSNLWNFRFMIGHCEELPCSVQLDIEEKFLNLERCVKFMNGDGYTDETAELIRNARALYLRRHWTIGKLPIFDMKRVKYCLLMDCNEMQTLVDQEDVYAHLDKATNDEDEILTSLQYLGVHFMKKLQRLSKGRIGSKSLSHLRILALHTCPEMTSIFSGSLLRNMQSLTELIVEDCPKVNCLVNMEDVTPGSSGPFLLNLRSVSLIDLPELVSISGGIRIAPQLDTLLVFNCMKLDYLSIMELPRNVKAIKGEIEWWDALKYGKLTWNNVFVELTRDGGLMDILAQDTNSLQHFLELDAVPSHPTSPMQVDQISSRDHVDQFQIKHDVPSSNESQKMSPQEILNTNKAAQSQYAEAGFGMWEPPYPVIRKPHNEDMDYDFKALNDKRAFMKKKRSSISIITSKHQVRVNKGIEVEKALDDGYIWRKYGQKKVLGCEYPRAYYRCSYGSTHGCCAKKQVQRSSVDPPVYEVTCMGYHTCSTRLMTSAESACKTLRTRDSSTATESDSTFTDSHFELPKSPQMLDSIKLSSRRGRNAEWTQHLHVSPKTEFDIPPDDGYSWKMYGQREPVGAKCSRCTSCGAKKRAQRSDNDPSIWEIAYKGTHTCLGLSVARNFASTTESAISIIKNSDSSTITKSASVITENSFGQEFTKMHCSSSIQTCRQQANETQSSFSSSIQYQSLLSDMIKSEVARKPKLGDRITELQQLVSPFGKTDTSSVLLETCEYIRFLHEQVSVLMTPYTKQGAPLKPQQKVHLKTSRVQSTYTLRKSRYKKKIKSQAEKCNCGRTYQLCAALLLKVKELKTNKSKVAGSKIKSVMRKLRMRHEELGIKHGPSGGFDELTLIFGDVGFWLESTLMDLSGKASRLQRRLKDIFLSQRCFSYLFPMKRCVWIDLWDLLLASWAQEVYKKLLVEGKQRFLRICFISNRTYRIIATEFAYWAPNIESMEVNSESNPLERKDVEGPSLDESLENEEHLDVDSCDSDSPKNVNTDSVPPSIGFARGDFVGGK
ncbi:WRKY domain-containing protein [Tanacetum coccineum]